MKKLFAVVALTLGLTACTLTPGTQGCYPTSDGKNLACVTITPIVTK